MKMKKLILLLTCVVVCCVTVAFVQKPASAQPTRNIYGYVNGLGTSDHAVASVIIYDTTARRSYAADNVYWTPLDSHGLRWYKNGLPTNHAYTVTVTPTDAEDEGLSHSFYLPSTPSNDQKVVDFDFDIN